MDTRCRPHDLRGGTGALLDNGRIELMNKLPLISNKSWYKRPLWIIAIVFVALLICANGWLFYKDSHPQSYINFTQYEPTKIVDDLKIESKTLNVWNSNFLSVVTVFMPYSVDLNLSLSRDNSYIEESQYKATQFDSTCDGINVTCTNKTTPKGQSYRLVLTRQPSNLQSQPLVYDKLTEQEATFKKGDTGFIIHIQSKDNTPIADTEWSDMIDSFKPTTSNDLQVRHMQPGP
jgi:hypothetical protein